jgi:hypothetical protein
MGGSTADRLVLIPMCGIAILIVGLLVNVLGWYFFESRAVVEVSVVIGILGLGIGFLGLFIAQIATFRHWYRQLKKK